jgi:protein-S-isoprenylcysteine O-methyltransferase Ste14
LTRFLEGKIPPVILGVAFAAAISALGRLVPGANVPFPGHRIVAVAGLALGGAIGVTGIVQFRRAGTTIHPLRPHEARVLVTSGIYRVSRNPMYLGIALCLAGIAAWNSTLPGYALVPLFCFALRALQIEREERALREAFGERFEKYAARVRRWI